MTNICSVLPFADCAKVCFDSHFTAEVVRFADLFMPILAQNLDPQLVSVCNNAIWAIGEIALKLGVGMTEHLPIVLGSLIYVMNREEGPKTLLENTGEFLKSSLRIKKIEHLNYQLGCMLRR